MSRILTQIVIALLVASVAPNAVALTSFVGFGAGAGGEGGAYTLNWTLETKGINFSARLLRTEEFQLIGPDYPKLSVTDVALLVGVRTPSGGHWTATCEIGLGYVMQVARGEYLRSDPGWFSSSYYEEINNNAVGFALQSQIYYRGFGLIIFGNANTAESFGGIALCFRIGKW